MMEDRITLNDSREREVVYGTKIIGFKTDPCGIPHDPDAGKREQKQLER